MSEEGWVAVVFLTIRVLLIGGILMILPRITRKGLLFGSYVGEEPVERAAARRLLVEWYRGCVMLMIVSLLVGWGIAFALHPLVGNLTGTGVLLLGALVLYLPIHDRARRLASSATKRQARVAVAPLAGDEQEGAGLARIALGICVLASIATYAYALIGYRRGSGQSFLVAMIVPSLNLLLSPFLALIALLTAKAKRSLRGGSGGGSLRAQNAFRALNSRVVSGLALLICAFLTYASVEITRVGLRQVDPLIFGLTAAAVLAFAAISLVRIMRAYGQGGALIENGTVEAPLTNGLADNAHWVLGLFYVDRHDPSIMVEKRFGLGYTFNYGNRTAITIVAGFLLLSLALLAVGFVGPFGS